MAIWATRVLVVEDDPEALRMVTQVLEAEGAQVLAITSPGQALAAIAGVMPDVLLVGLEMAGLDGIALMRKVRTLAPEKGGRVPAAALSTGALGPVCEQILREAGFQAHLAKPLLGSEVRAWVDGLAGGAVERRHEARDRELWPDDVRQDRRREDRGAPVCGNWRQ